MRNLQILVFTVWKLHNFSVTQTLREITVVKFSNSKSTILTELEALYFGFYEFLHFLKAEFAKFTKFRAFKNCKISSS